MEHLDEISIEELQDALDNVEGKKPTERLLAAIAYKNGVTQNELAEWYGVHQKTIYNWLKRLVSVVTHSLYRALHRAPHPLGAHKTGTRYSTS